jgi:hypothetical protein
VHQDDFFVLLCVFEGGVEILPEFDLRRALDCESKFKYQDRQQRGLSHMPSPSVVSQRISPIKTGGTLLKNIHERRLKSNRCACNLDRPNQLSQPKIA